MRILIAEDNELLLEALTDCIEAKLPDCKLFTAKNGADAVNALEYRHIDLVITDWEMPRGGGAVVVAKAKELNVPAYIHTGSVNIHSDERTHGVCGIIRKGTPMNSIIELIKAERV